ncbi:hypothetical protein [Labrenzia sp. 011]|uniref:hypothetical protein n=1 Tax=Labrenzia sp. 011 TaxID=2171494 RepID=UPI0014026D02|nr:hypothetical protein [Labrenzia sp. 011]
MPNMPENCKQEHLFLPWSTPRSDNGGNDAPTLIDDPLFRSRNPVHQGGKANLTLLLYPACGRDNDVSVAAARSGQQAHAFLLHFLAECLGAVGDRDDGGKRATQHDGKEDEDKKAVQHGRLLAAIRFDCPEITGAALNSC